MISVVIPVFGCNECIRELVSGVMKYLPSDKDFEIILVDDASVDGSWETISSIASSHLSVKGIRLSRNVGQHLAIHAGLRAATGEQVIVMDCDLQDPPELIPGLLAEMKSFPIVLAVRQGQHQTLTRTVQNKIFSITYRALTGKVFQSDVTSYSAISRQVVDEYVKFTELGQHYLFVLRWLGFNQGYVAYQRPIRPIGKSSYSFKTRLLHASDGMLFDSTRIIRLALFFGCFVATVGFAAAFFVIFRAIRDGALSGWPSTVSLILILSGLSISLQAVLGAYIARSFEQGKSRPLYVISETI